MIDGAPIDLPGIGVWLIAWRTSANMIATMMPAWSSSASAMSAIRSGRRQRDSPRAPSARRSAARTAGVGKIGAARNGNRPLSGMRRRAGAFAALVISRLGMLVLSIVALSCACPDGRSSALSSREGGDGVPPSACAVPPPTAAPVAAAPQATAIEREPEPAVDPKAVEPPPLEAAGKEALHRFAATQSALANEHEVIRDGADGFHMTLSPRAIAALPALKHAARDAARHVLAAARNAGTTRPSLLAAQVARALREAQAGDGSQPIGAIAYVDVQRPSGHPTKLGLAIGLTIPCGSDGSLYVLQEEERGLARVLLEVEEHGYSSISGGLLALTYRLSEPDEKGGWFVVVANTSPWCTSMWRTIRWRVFEPSTRPSAPRLVLSGQDHARFDFTRSDEEFCSISAVRDSFELRYTSWAHPFRSDVYTPHVRRFARGGSGFVRTQPIASRAIDLPGEWVDLPWGEAQRYVAGNAEALRPWHERLASAARDEHATLTMERTDQATGRVLLSLACDACKELSAKTAIQVVPDGAGWAIASIAAAP